MDISIENLPLNDTWGKMSLLSSAQSKILSFYLPHFKEKAFCISVCSNTTNDIQYNSSLIKFNRRHKNRICPIEPQTDKLS